VGVAENARCSGGKGQRCLLVVILTFLTALQPKQWTELQAGIECLTQLLLLIDSMSVLPDATLSEAAETLQHQLYYNGEVLDLAFEGLQGYKEQSIA
jgi:hypothetical protein